MLIVIGMPERSGSAGFSFIEVLVAISVLSVGVVSLAQLFTVATASNISSRHTTLASVLASQKLEQLRARPWADLTPSPGTALQEDTPGFVDEVGTYTRRWSIDPLPAAPDDAVVIQVRVIRAFAGPAEHVRMVTVRSRTP